MKNKQFALLIILFFTKYLSLSGQGTKKDAYEILVHNASKFDITCIPQCDKDEGVFTASATYLKAGQTFLYRVMRTPGGILPRGVEGTLTFQTIDKKYSGTGQVHFNNPAVGSADFDITATNWPINIIPLSDLEIAKLYMGYFIEPASYVKILVDTSKGNIGKVNPPTLNGEGSTKGKGGSQPAESLLEPIPPIINFDWKVDQRMRKEDIDDDDDNKGKAYKEVTYLFTSNGDYAAVKPDDASFSLMIYSKKGYTWMIDDNRKTITVMSMPKTVGEGAAIGKAFAEDIKKGPLRKDRDDEKFTITKTGKTKSYLGYTAEEYELKNTIILTTKNVKSGTASFWYCKVPFDPVKIYTMGVGRPADMSKLQNDPKMKNNITAIPVLNKNYLWVETEMGGLKGLETTNIQKVNTTIYTTGYQVKNMKSLKDMVNDPDN